MGEGALADGLYLIGGDKVFCELALHKGRNCDESLSVIGEDVVCCLNLIGLVLLSYLKFLDSGISECEHADVVNVGADGDLSHVFALVEHTLGKNCGVNVEFLKRFAACEAVSRVLDLLCLDGHVLKGLTACKGVLTDGEKSLAELDALKLLVSCECVIGDNADGGKLKSAAKVAALKCVLADDLQVVLT